jgi:hypothetical protein
MATKKVTPKTTPVTKKTPVKKAPVKRTIKKISPVPATTISVDMSSVNTATKSAGSMVDKAIDLIKWVDTPFKLFEVILLASVFFFGYFAWDIRTVILDAITQSSKVSNLKEVNHLVPVVDSLQKDLEATTVIVHKASLNVNTRKTMIAFGPKGRDNSLDGLNSSLFSKDQSRNAGIIGMLNGEIVCDKISVLDKSAEWEFKQGVTFVCRGGIPPEIGDFDGYVAVGWRKEPSDIAVIKTRINLASSEMSQ